MQNSLQTSSRGLITPTYTTALSLLNDIRNILLLASQASPVLPHYAVASHIRIRSQTEDQFSVFRELTQDTAIFYARHTLLHKERQIIFAPLTSNTFHFNSYLHQPINWLEFTAPRQDHIDGPDALVFKVEGLAQAEEHKIMLSPLFHLRYQSLSAEDIVTR